MFCSDLREVSAGVCLLQHYCESYKLSPHISSRPTGSICLYSHSSNFLACNAGDGRPELCMMLWDLWCATDALWTRLTRILQLTNEAIYKKTLVEQVTRYSKIQPNTDTSYFGYFPYMIILILCNFQKTQYNTVHSSENSRTMMNHVKSLQQSTVLSSLLWLQP